jgi:hypothetical protein
VELPILACHLDAALAQEPVDRILLNNATEGGGKIYSKLSRRVSRDDTRSLQPHILLCVAFGHEWRTPSIVSSIKMIQ